MLPSLGIQNVDEDNNQHNLRRRSSQIISADQSFNKEGPTHGRDREDSITAFKKFDKVMMQSFDTNKNITSPVLSPSHRSTPNNPTPLINQMLAASPLQQGFYN